MNQKQAKLLRRFGKWIVNVAGRDAEEAVKITTLSRRVYLRGNHRERGKMTKSILFLMWHDRVDAAGMKLVHD